jgi:hypothetical protein
MSLINQFDKKYSLLGLLGLKGEQPEGGKKKNKASI